MKAIQRLNNIKQVLKSRKYLAIAFGAAALIGTFFYFATQYSLIAGNVSINYAKFTVALEVLLSLLFGLNVSLLWCKIGSLKQLVSKDTGTAATGSLFGILITGCPACSLGLASYLGLSSVILSLPLLGMELKILGVILLIYSTYSISGNLYTCKIRLRKDK